MKRIIFVLLAVYQIHAAYSQNPRFVWNNWTDAMSLKTNLLKAQKEGKSYFSQFHIYNVKGNDINSSVYLQHTGENLYIYGLDFYYASGSYFSEEYKAKMRANIIKVVKKQWRENKAIPSFSWHLENPYVPSKFNRYMGCRYHYGAKELSYPTEHRFVIKEILTGEGGEKCGYGKYKQNGITNNTDYENPQIWFNARCKEVADIINEFIDDNGKPIPFIFRLWHECEDNWHWWGRTMVTPEDYKMFFIYTEQEIKHYAPKSQIIWAYCPDSNWKLEKDFILRYPGDKYVDIIGYDDYKLQKREKLAQEIEKAKVVTHVAENHGKIAALFETSNKKGDSMDTFFKNCLSPILTTSGVRMGFVQTWSTCTLNNEQQIADRKWFLQQPYILKIKE